MQHALVPVPGCARLVGVDARHKDQPLLNPLLQLCKPAGVCADGIFVVRRAWTDNHEKPAAPALKDISQLTVLLVLHLPQHIRQRNLCHNFIGGRNFLNVIKSREEFRWRNYRRGDEVNIIIRKFSSFSDEEGV